MNTKNIISLILFLAFFSSYLIKLYFQARQSHINPVSLGKKQKQKDQKTMNIEQLVRGTTFVWGVLWVMEIFFEERVHRIFSYFFTPLGVLGIILSMIGLVWFIMAMKRMGQSWRVGIDKEHQTDLINEGIYKYSRNPAFVGFDFMFLGLFLTFPDLLTFVVMTLNIVAMHLLILQEEKHLTDLHGEKYLRYMSRVPRYIFFLK